MADVNARAIERKLDRIRSLGLEELRLEWRRLYHCDAPRISRDLLILGLGYRLQEIEQGGLGKATRRKLQSYPSLTKIANKITAGHWSGPRFFGLPAVGTGRSDSEGRNG